MFGCLRNVDSTSELQISSQTYFRVVTIDVNNINTQMQVLSCYLF